MVQILILNGWSRASRHFLGDLFLFLALDRLLLPFQSSVLFLLGSDHGFFGNQYSHQLLFLYSGFSNCVQEVRVIVRNAAVLPPDILVVTPTEALPHIGRQPRRNAKDDRCNLPALL